MLPLSSDHFDPDAPGRPFWVRLIDLAIAAVIVCAIALIGSFLGATSAHAQTDNVKPITPAVAADQQEVADTFFELKLSPKKINVLEAATAGTA